MTEKHFQIPVIFSGFLENQKKNTAENKRKKMNQIFAKIQYVQCLLSASFWKKDFKVCEKTLSKENEILNQIL